MKAQQRQTHVKNGFAPFVRYGWQVLKPDPLFLEDSQTITEISLSANFIESPIKRGMCTKAAIFFVHSLISISHSRGLAASNLLSSYSYFCELYYFYEKNK